jgi:hypothetical protein
MLTAQQTDLLNAWFQDHIEYLSTVIFDVEEDQHFGGRIWDKVSGLSPGGGPQMLIDDINDYIRGLQNSAFFGGARRNPELLIIENPEELQKSADGAVKSAVQAFAELLDSIKMEVSNLVGADVTQDPRMDAILQEMIPRMVKDTDIMQVHAARQQD